MERFNQAANTQVSAGQLYVPSCISTGTTTANIISDVMSPSSATKNGKALPTKQASLLQYPQPNSIHTISQQQLNTQDEGTPQRRKSVGRSISTMFKGLFKSKNSADGSSNDSGSISPEGSSGQCSPSKVKEEKSFSLKAVLFASFTAGEDRTQLQVQPSSKSSTAQLEGEVQAAMKRAQSITGRQNAPATLLAVSADVPPRMTRTSWSLKDYTVVEKMYTGYASNVYKAFCKLSGETVCLKAYSLGNLCELNRFQIFREVKLHSSLSHEHVIKLYGAFQQGDQVVLVQEYAGAGDLFNLLHRYGGRLPERTAVELVMAPFLAVIHYLHTNGIAHRDIKPENILFTTDMRLKLCDFGLAINMRDERAVTRAGTLEYMSPEVLNCPFKNKPDENKDNQGLHYSYAVDTWAAGVLTYELLVGLPPFADKQRSAVEDKIREDMPRFPSKIGELARDFINRALDKDPLERPTVLEMVNHRWIRMHRRSSSVRQLPVARAQSFVQPSQQHQAAQQQLQQLQQKYPVAQQASSSQSPSPVTSQSQQPNLLRSTSKKAMQAPVSIVEGDEDEAHSGALPNQPFSTTPQSRKSVTIVLPGGSSGSSGSTGTRAMVASKSFTAGALPKSVFS